MKTMPLLMFVLLAASTLLAQTNVLNEKIDWLEVRVNGADDDSLPRPLLIGDSISGGYFPGVTAELKGRVNVARLGSSRGLGDPRWLDELRLVLGQYKFDVIHFNNGLHGWNITEGEYRATFPKLLELLHQCAPQAKLIWATTTPLRIGAPKFEQFDARNQRVTARNKIAAEFIAKSGIPMDDLYDLEVNHPENMTDGCHYKPAAAAAQAKQVAQFIVAALPKNK